MKTLILSLVTAIILIASTPITQAALVVDVFGLPGSNQTTWTFSGSYILGSSNGLNGEYSFNGDQNFTPGANMFNHGSGDLSGDMVDNTLGNNFLIGILSGDGTVTGSTSGVHNIDGLLLDDDSSAGSGGDDFAWLADGAFSSGETVTLAGSIVIGVDITTFAGGGPYPANMSSTSEQTPLTMNFSNVPEPSGAALILGAFSLLALRRRS